MGLVRRNTQLYAQETVMGYNGPPPKDYHSASPPPSPPPKKGFPMRSILSDAAKTDANSLDHLRGGEAYKEGQMGYIRGAQDAPTHWGNQSRVSWWVGFLDSRTYNALSHIFNKYQINYP